MKFIGTYLVYAVVGTVLGAAGWTADTLEFWYAFIPILASLSLHDWANSRGDIA